MRWVSREAANNATRRRSRLLMEGVCLHHRPNPSNNRASVNCRYCAAGSSRSVSLFTFCTLTGGCSPRVVSTASTRIIYDRKFLLDCRNSPLARTPPCCLPQIPGVTVPATHPMGKLQDLKEEAEEEEKDVPDDNQFEMDI
uniref:Eukaryotic translation initiation factor 4E binding protein 3 n=1 Tax=Gasterosteus aculeatus aculeatus TaxID=481459 RepID=A0AAQ4PNV4_GASAC